ncbi:MAG: hypothetical protein KIT31_42820 [Deltaproteobacteria bacterium]|nr:hypothetical protein [Deltaproteobacteria bacterium]
MRRALAWILVLLLLAAGCGTAAKPVTGGGSDSATAAAADDNDDAILAAVVLHELANGHVKPDETPCLRVRDAAGATADASAAMLALVQRRWPRAVVASACSGGGPDPVRAGDGAGVMFDVGPVQRNPAGVVVEGGGAHRGGGAIREIEYKLQRGPTGWRVSSEQVLREG